MDDTTMYITIINNQAMPCLVMDIICDPLYLNKIKTV